MTHTAARRPAALRGRPPEFPDALRHSSCTPLFDHGAIAAVVND